MARTRHILAARDLLLQVESAYVACHIAPDGDAVGSMLALTSVLQALGKRCVAACADPLPQKWSFLSGSQAVTCDPPRDEQVIVSVDCSDVERLGSLFDPMAFATRPVINIDHHVTNTGFGTINLVRPLPSTAEIVHILIRQLAVTMDSHIANALLVGLVTDTRGFRTANVAARQLRTAIALLKDGASLPYVTEMCFNREPLSTVCLWGQALAMVQTRGRIIWAQVTQDMIKRCNATPDDSSGLVSFLASTADMDVAAVFRELADGLIEVSMRAGLGWDLADLARSMGGGGHPQAAGCRIRGELAHVRDHVLQQIELELAKQARARPDHQGPTLAEQAVHPRD